MSFEFLEYAEFKPYEGPRTEYDLSKLVYLCDNTDYPYYLDGVRMQLSPKKWLEMLSYDGRIDPDIHFILDGLLYGFNVIDTNAEISSYYGTNYHSCYKEDNPVKLSNLLEHELSLGKFSKVSEIPYCVQSLGIIKKKNSSKIRPITDCSMPKDVSVNSYMKEVCDKFSYTTIGDVVSSILGGKCEFISTLDLVGLSFSSN